MERVFIFIYVTYTPLFVFTIAQYKTRNWFSKYTEFILQGVSQSNILGNIETNRINGVYLSNIKDAMRSKISETLNGEVLLTIQEIVSLIESSLYFVKSIENYC